MLGVAAAGHNGAVPPTGTVNNLNGKETKLKCFAIWAMKVDAVGVRSTLGSEKAAASGWDSDVVTLKTLGRVRDMPLSGRVAVVLLLGVEESDCFLPIVQDCLEQDWEINFPEAASRRLASALSKGTAGMIVSEGTSVAAAAAPRTLSDRNPHLQTVDQLRLDQHHRPYQLPHPHSHSFPLMDAARASWTTPCRCTFRTARQTVGRPGRRPHPRNC